MRLAGSLWRAWLRRAALTAATCGLALGAASGVALAKDMRVTLKQARSAAVNALAAGRAEDALVLSEGVLLGNPEDTVALFVKARALRSLDRKSEAVAAARDAWSVSEGPKERYYAAMLMAQMRSFAGSNVMAQMWLRRAAEIAPEDDMKAVAVKDFRHVRRITPWRIAFDLFLSPSDNLNNAPTKAMQVPTGTVRVTPPLSGLRFGAGVTLRRTKMLSPRSRLHFSGFASGSAVELSSEAKAVPGAEAGDYGQAMLGGGLAWEGMSTKGDRLTRAKVSARRYWQAGAPIGDALRLDLAVEQALTPELRLSGRVGLEDVTRHDSSTGDAQRREVGVALTQSVGPGALSLGLDLGETFSAAYNVGRTDGGVTLSYGWAKPVSGLLPTVTLAYDVYNYDAPWVGTPTGPARRDRQRAVALDVLVPGLDYYGFAPEIGLSFTDRNSNYTLYENRGTDLRFGLKSIF